MPGGAAGGQRSAATALSPPSTPHTASCPQPLWEKPGRYQHLHPPGSPLSPPRQGSSFLPGLRPDTTHFRATLEQPGAAARVTHARATLLPVSAVTHGPSLALGTRHPSWLGSCFGRGGGSWTRLGGHGLGQVVGAWREAALGHAAGVWRSSAISNAPLPSSPSLGQEGKEQKGVGGIKTPARVLHSNSPTSWHRHPKGMGPHPLGH